MRKALPAGQFELHYQPVVNSRATRSAASRPSSAGAIPRGASCRRLAFIPLAEEIGFIVLLGEWAIKRPAHGCEVA